MKLSIITLDRRIIKVEMSDSQDVRSLKQRLSDMPEVAMPPDSQQLIYAGRILEDELPLSNYKIAENKNIVLMGKKVVPPAEPKEQERKQDPVSVPCGIPTPPPAAGPIGALSQPTVALPSVAPNEQRVRDLMDMGYEEQEVRDALRASYNHPERAIEYLISGIPPQAATDTQMPAAQTTTGNMQQPMIASPALARVRQMIRDDPRLLNQILAHLAETEPEAFEIVRNHQAEFLALIQGTEDDTAGETVQVNLTADEAAAVGRLEALGFQRALAVQAYLACDKNEEMAAMILFNQAEDEDHDQEQLP